MEKLFDFRVKGTAIALQEKNNAILRLAPSVA